MIDFRLYRIAWLPALVAFVTMMFALEGIPAPLEPQLTPAAFDDGRAEANARRILALADERAPGGEGDAAAADLVLERFEAIEAGTTGQQVFEAEVDGEERELRNVTLSLPGESDRVVLVTAPRDSGSGPGAASSAAATAALLELAQVLGATDHNKAFVVVSTDASTEGAAGIERFLGSFADRDLIEAAIVLTQPGSGSPTRPYVLRHSTDDRSTSMQLVRTAEETVTVQTTRRHAPPRLFAGLARLAMPVAAGEQGVLISEGVDAVGLSSAGERPLDPADDQPQDLDPEVLAQFGGAALGIVLAIDAWIPPIEHGPDAYVEFSGSLVPGWSIAMLALALIAPAAVAAVDGVARAARRRAGTIRSLSWSVALALPLLATLVVLYLLSVAGVVADAPYPFDPARFDFGPDEALVLVLLAVVAIAGYALGGLTRPPRRARRDALVPALGATAVLGGTATWLANPYLALLLVPAVHVWLLAGRERPPSRPLLVAAGLGAVLPVLLAMRISIEAVGAGVWDCVLMVTDGHISAAALVAGCPLAGSLVGLLLLAWRPGTDWTNPLGARPQRARGPRGSGSDEFPMDPNRRAVDDAHGRR
jgi:Peptidase family M28